MPESESFGVLFGRLVRDKRGVEDLSQDDLAGLSALSKARISNLENGKTPSPHARTIDALCVALNISRQERAACHAPTGPQLPPRLLENLALRFGHSNPDALEDELEAFLKDKAVEFGQMQARLAKLTQTEDRIAKILAAANLALEEGDFQGADQRLAQAEEVQFASTTLAALEGQCRLRFARGHAALLSGEVDGAVEHFEAAANYFHFLDQEVEAEKRYDYCDDLRAYGYRYRSVAALLAAKGALTRNLAIWTKEGSLRNWCRAMNALGGANWRLSQFDAPELFADHIAQARTAFEAVREACSETILPYYYATSGGNLASVYTERDFAKSDAEYYSNLQFSLKTRVSSLELLSKEGHPVEWGMAQHNTGLGYIQLFQLQTDKPSTLDLIDSAIDHLERSFEVRDPVDMLQYWVASRRSLGEALIEKSTCQPDDQALLSLQRARDLLTEAASEISQAEHPNQWAQLQEQLAKCPP